MALINLMSTYRERDAHYKARSTTRDPHRSKRCRTNNLDCCHARLTYVRMSHLLEGITKMMDLPIVGSPLFLVAVVLAHLISPAGEVGK